MWTLNPKVILKLVCLYHETEYLARLPVLATVALTPQTNHSRICFDVDTCLHRRRYSCLELLWLNPFPTLSSPAVYIAHILVCMLVVQDAHLLYWTRFARTLLKLTSAFQSSNSESSISSPEHAAGSCSSRCAVGPCSPLSSGDSSEVAGPTDQVSYLQINSLLREAHFQSLESRGHLRDTWWLYVDLSAAGGPRPWSMLEHHMLNHFTRLFPTHLRLQWNLTALHVCGWRPAPGQLSGGCSSFK